MTYPDGSSDELQILHYSMFRITLTETESQHEFNNYDVIELSPGVMVINWQWKHKQPSGRESLPSACHHSANTKLVVFVHFPFFHFLHKY